MTLGTVPVVDLAEARRRARAALEVADAGHDPAVERAAELAERRELRANSFKAVAKLFIERHRKQRNRSSTVADGESVLRRLVYPRWSDKPVAEIRRRDVIALLDEVAAESAKPRATLRLGAANKVLREVKAILSWAVERDLIDTNPAAKVKMPVPDRSRDRVLMDDELREVWHAAGATGFPFGPVVKLLALTGQRRAEVATMRWADLRDLDTEEPTWVLPREATKADREHTVPLSPEAIAILNDLPHFKGPYVFTTTGGERPISGFSKYRGRLEKKVKEARRKELGEEAEPLPAWRLHDLRRTVASGMARLGVQPVVLARVLNHSPGSVQGVTAIYNRHSYLGEQRRALDAWGAHVATVVTDREAASNVVALERA